MTNLPDKPAGKVPWQARLQSVTGKSLGARDRTVYLVFDTSRSMADRAKLEKARSGALGFFDEAVAREFQVGLVAFSTEARLAMPPQGDRRTFADILAGLNAGGSTNMAAAIELAESQLLASRRERVICIVTDGVPDDRAAALAAAEYAKLRGIEIMGIGTDDADEAFLARLVSRRELSRKVERESLTSQVASMALLLPKPGGR